MVWSIPSGVERSALAAVSTSEVKASDAQAAVRDGAFGNMQDPEADEEDEGQRRG
jgi:hypothetical protein